MRVDVLNLLTRAAELVGTKPSTEEEQLTAVACRRALRSLAWDLDELAKGRLSFDQFCTHYCLERKPAPRLASHQRTG